MKVSASEFDSLLSACTEDIHHRRIARREQLTGLGLHLALTNQDKLNHGWLQQALEEQAERHDIRRGIGGYILSQIIALIVGKILEWLLDSQKKTKLVCASEADEYELPELR